MKNSITILISLILTVFCILNIRHLYNLPIEKDTSVQITTTVYPVVINGKSYDCLGFGHELLVGKDDNDVTCDGKKIVGIPVAQ